jgi:hypothetical protein
MAEGVSYAVGLGKLGFFYNIVVLLISQPYLFKLFTLVVPMFRPTNKIRRELQHNGAMVRTVS